LLLPVLSGQLAEAGLDSVNISIDTLDPKKFHELTGSDSFNKVIEGIKRATELFPTVKLNTVVIRDVNDTEVHQLIQFANDLKIDIRFIEYMPTSNNKQKRSEYISGDEIKKLLPYDFIASQIDRHAAARYYSAPELSIKVGFINPVSHSFCALCNRIRLTSDGRLYGCLFSNSSFNLFDALKKGYGSAADKIKLLIDNKKYSGCSNDNSQNSHSPSFLNMGG
jgi:cyclic pyranopterin phosphate synthase